MASQANSVKHLREELTPTLKLFQKNCRGRHTPKLILWGHYHLCTKTIQWYHTQKKEITGQYHWWTTDAKILNKILADWIQQYRNTYTMIKWSLTQGCQDSKLYKNPSVWYTPLTKNKNRMIISIDAEKACDEMWHPFLIKTLWEVDTEGNLPQHNKYHVWQTHS